MSADGNAADLDEVRQAAAEVLAQLERAGSIQAPKVAAQIGRLDDPEQRHDAIRNLHGLAHIKALGDIYLETSPGWDWPDAVSNMRLACAAWLAASK